MTVLLHKNAIVTRPWGTCGNDGRALALTKREKNYTRMITYFRYPSRGRYARLVGARGGVIYAESFLFAAALCPVPAELSSVKNEITVRDRDGLRCVAEMTALYSPASFAAEIVRVW